MKTRSSTDILQELSRIKGVNAVVVVGRDGLVIESIGYVTNTKLDILGAAIASAINNINDMGTELKVGEFVDLFINYHNAMIMCFPIGEVICGIASTDSSKLGMIRHMSQKLIPELEKMY
ncbi:MAG: roadblock/LC7 domain-containing protein [Methanoregula sp.]|nr:roadblock/LC7 domain-containing protein [Methanoregula sp.]